jgi:hypothetical protein
MRRRAVSLSDNVLEAAERVALRRGNTVSGAVGDAAKAIADAGRVTDEANRRRVAPDPRRKIQAGAGTRPNEPLG